MVMKRTLFILLFLLISFQACQNKQKSTTTGKSLPKTERKSDSETARKPQKPARPVYPYKKVIEKLPHGIRFNICGVDTAKQLLQDTTFYEALSIACGRKIEGFSTFEAHKRFSPIYSTENGFIFSLHQAYNAHYPFTISPDMIWLLICQGVSNHININAEKMRHLFVQHEGKYKITIEENDFTKYGYNPWQNILPKLSDTLQKYVKGDIQKIIVNKFSTTTTNETIAFQVTLMEAMQKYFDYRTFSGCGIPYITLEGTPQDWRKIRQDIEKLRPYKLSDWVDSLIPILDEFVQASEGKVHEEFWREIYKYEFKYEPMSFNGWISVFFPYLKEYAYSTGMGLTPSYRAYGKLKSNPLLKNKDYRKAKLEMRDIPQGTSSFDFMWIYRKEIEKDYAMAFTSGFMGFEQDKTTKALRPVIHWAVYDKNAPNLHGR